MTKGLYAYVAGEPRLIEGISQKTQKPYSFTLQNLLFKDGDAPLNESALVNSVNGQCFVPAGGYQVGKTYPVLAGSFRATFSGREPRIELGTVILDVPSI